MKLRKTVMYFLLSVPIIPTGSCQKQPSITLYDDPVPFQQLDSSTNDILFTIDKNSYLSSPKSITTKIENISTHKYYYGNYYFIEKRQDNLWYGIVYSDAVFYKYPDLRDSGFMLEPFSTVHYNFSLERLNLTLPNGKYRLVKTLIKSDSARQEITLAIPFEITN